MAGLTEKELLNITRQTILGYEGTADDFKIYLLLDDDRHIYAVNGVRHAPGPKRGFIIVQARVVGEQIIVDVDSVWDKNLWQALVKAGVPREQIVLAYLGEKVPQPSQS